MWLIRLIGKISILLTVVSSLYFAGMYIFFPERRAEFDSYADIEVAGTKFRIPHEYFDRAPPRDGVRDSFLLEVVWPDLRPTLRMQKIEKDRLFKEHKIGWILVLANQKMATFDQYISRITKPPSSLKFIGTEYGLDKYLYERGKPGITARVTHDDYYIEKKENITSSFIACSIHADDKPFPTCSHSFNLEGIRFQTTYNKTGFLADWQQLRQRSINLIQSFQVSSHQPTQQE